MGILDAPTYSRGQADARFGNLTEAKRRRSTFLPLMPTAAASAPPTLSLAKGSGVSAVAIASGGSGYAAGDQITVAGGTASTAAVLQVVAVSGGAITGVAVARPGVYSANPGNPVSQASTTGSGTGATFTLTLNGGVGSTINDVQRYTVSATDARIRFVGVGPANQASSGYYGNGNVNGVACWFEWSTDAASFDVRLLGLNSGVMLYVDGVRVNNAGAGTDASGSAYVWTVTGDGKPHSYKLWGINMAFGGLNLPGGATVWAPPESRRPFAWCLGDSYAFGTNATHTSMAGINQMGDLLGIEVLASGIGGSGWNSASPNDPVNRVATQLAVLTRTPDIVFLDMGYNDSGGNMTTLASRFDATVAAVRAAVPKAVIIAFGPATPIGQDTNLTTVKTTIAGRCNANGVTFIDVSAFVTGSNKPIYTGGDNTHPTQAGYDYIAARRAQVLSPLLSA